MARRSGCIVARSPSLTSDRNSPQLAGSLRIVTGLILALAYAARIVAFLVAI